MVSPYVSNVFLCVTFIKNIWQWQVFSIYFGYFFLEALIIFTFKILRHGISSNPILIPLHLPYRVFEAKHGSSHELTERAQPRLTKVAP